MRTNYLPTWIGTILSCLALVGCGTSSTDYGTSSDYPHVGEVIRLDARMNDLVATDAIIERLADGFEWSEGPVWLHDEGALLFSDIPTNTIYRWEETAGLHPFLRPAGYAWSDPPGAELGTNGLAVDFHGHLVMCDHGNRQISRLDRTNFTRTPLVSTYQGMRLNSPNDLVFHSNGDLYFTDPPYGLRGLNDSPHKELPFNGVYRLSANPGATGPAPQGTDDEATSPALQEAPGGATSPEAGTAGYGEATPAHRCSGVPQRDRLLAR